MRLLLLVLAILPCFRQDADIDRLIQQLADDDVGVRDAADLQLRRIGAKAIPALKKAEASPEKEIVVRALALRLDIDRAENRTTALGRTNHLALPEGEVSLSDLVALVKNQTSVELEVPKQLLQDRVKIAGGRTLFWESLDRACAAHGGIRLPWSQAKAGVALEPGPPGGGPVFYSGGLRVGIERLQLERGRSLGKDYAFLAIKVVAMWHPDIRPLRDGMLVDEVVDGVGERLGRASRTAVVMRGYGSGVGGFRNCADLALLEAPAEGVRRLKSIKGHVGLSLPLMTPLLAFEKPADSVGQVRHAGAYAIELVSYHSDASGKRADFRCDVPDWDGRIREIALVDPRGKRYPGKVASRENRLLTITFPKEAPSDLLELRLVSETFDERIDFEFKNVELP